MATSGFSVRRASDSWQPHPNSARTQPGHLGLAKCGPRAEGYVPPTPRIPQGRPPIRTRGLERYRGGRAGRRSRPDLRRRTGKYPRPGGNPHPALDPESSSPTAGTSTHQDRGIPSPELLPRATRRSARMMPAAVSGSGVSWCLSGKAMSAFHRISTRLAESSRRWIGFWRRWGCRRACARLDAGCNEIRNSEFGIRNFHRTIASSQILSS